MQARSKGRDARGVAAADSAVLLWAKEGPADVNLAILQARMSSSRLPGKVMAPVLGEPMISRQVERLRRSDRIDALMVATSSDPSDDGLAAYCETILGLGVFRGELDDVLGRFA